MVMIMFLSYSLGAKMICMPQFTSNNLLDVLEQNPITAMYVAPPVVQLIASDARFKRKHLEHIKFLTSGAAPLGHELIAKFHSKMGTHFQFGQGYGMSEASPLVSRSKYSDWKSVGLILVNTHVRILGTTDNFQKNLGVNETGEIAVKGPQVMKRYYKNAKATEDCMDGEWYKTGDLGHVDQDGID